MLAIVIPYFRLTFLEATLQSLADQTDQRFRVYIGDDASPENPEMLLQKFNGKFSFSYHKFTENLGGRSLVRQWQRCLELTADEELVMIVGHDDVLGKDCVAQFHQLEAKAGSNVIRFATHIIDAEGKEISPLFTHPEKERSTDFLLRKFTGQTRSSLGEYIFRKPVLMQKGFRDFPLAWHSDEMAILECSGFGDVLSLNNAMVYIRESELSISGKTTNLEQKQLATYLFCSELIEKHSPHFNKTQKLKLLGRIERYYFRHKKDGSFFAIAFWYLSKTGLINLIKFVRRYFLSQA